MSDPGPEMVSIEALKQAQATISLLQTYCAALGGAIGVMGTFFGYKWVSAIVENTKASGVQAASNEKLAEAVKALSEAVLRGKG